MSLRTRFIVPLLLLHDELKTNHHHQENNNNTRKEAEGGKGGKRKTPRVSLCAVLSRDNFNFPSPCNFVGCLLTLLLPLPLMLLNVLLPLLRWSRRAKLHAANWRFNNVMLVGWCSWVEWHDHRSGTFKTRQICEYEFQLICNSCGSARWHWGQERPDGR